ncbi:Calx-beta domain-containing protein [Cytophagaceae bacterium DM2B3-1]|uniref:Calx-beta domain-containing protein n=1 Tax=Xanthocytophaga flava TaxID=3048013 RepID=A0ABT7CMX3_9BACT|nr:Calx-beta domain-containing protein [Xanthocytophaga flavus]MDJ1472090.1 Calx-beta domain-containing protein [Xanthocytophaga flavus]MDJ1495086.1 Calx-beta domain-containing protein [Xanthocytophaga flavus]
MKKLLLTKVIQIIFITGLAGSVFSCEADRITFQGPYHVRFTDTVASVKESYPQIVKVQIHNVGPQLNEDITVKYLVGGTAREGIDYTILGTKGTVVIPANQSFGEIQVRLINNANDRLESQTLTFTLTDVSPTSLIVGFGKNNNIGRHMTYTIEDDCILGGYYIGTRKIGSSTITVPNVEVTSVDCDNFILSNWNIGFANRPDFDIFSFNAIHPTLSIIDKKDNTIEIPAQNNGDVVLSGTGSWNPQNGNLLLNIQLKFPLSNPTRDTVIALPTLTFIPQKN